MKKSKLMKLYWFLVSLSTGLRYRLVRWLYNRFVPTNCSEKSIFLNYGYHDDITLHLDEQDQSNRLFIQLYHRAVQAIELRGKDIAEIGCGQGAGALFLVKYFQPRSYIGIDLSEKAIAFCQRHNKLPDIQWMQGCSDKLPIPDESVDVVINIESSHLYPSMIGFVNEVKRVLRPNGYLAFADLRHHSQVDALDRCFKTSGLQILQRSDITLQVLDSLTRLSDRRNAHINSTYPRLMRRAIREITAVKGTCIYNGFINGQQKYLYYLLQKQ